MSELTREQIDAIACSIYGTLSTAQEVEFARAIIAAMEASHLANSGNGEGYFLVTVDCWSTYKASGKERGHCLKRKILTPGVDQDAAIATAIEFCRKTSPLGPRWVEFEFRECGARKVPYDTTNPELNKLA